MKYLKYASVMVFTGLLFFGCSGASKVESSLNNDQIKIDGSQSDWAGSLNTVKDDNLAYGFKNDGQNLYLCLVTSDASKATRILTMGLTVWLDPGSSKDVIGVKFPLRPERGEMRDFRMQMPQDSASPRSREQRIQNLIAMQKELTVTNKEDLPLYTSEVSTAKDFQASISYQKDQFVYELKVPLEGNSGAQAFLKARPGDDVEVKIETGKIDMSQRGGGGMRMGSGGEGGNRPPMGEGREGGGGRRRGGGGERGGARQNFKPLDYTFEVKLAK